METTNNETTEGDAGKMPGSASRIDRLFPPNIHKGDIGRQRTRIAQMLTGEDLAELFALADFCISCGGSLNFVGPSDLAKRLKQLRLVEWIPQPGLGRGTKLHRLTKLGWFTLLTRAKDEMRHLIPQQVDDIE